MDWMSMSLWDQERWLEDFKRYVGSEYKAEIMVPSMLSDPLSMRGPTFIIKRHEGRDIFAAQVCISAGIPLPQEIADMLIRQMNKRFLNLPIIGI